jgi:hypothetical protein
MPILTQRRVDQRRQRQHPAWITFDNDFQSHECQVLDVSNGGAKLLTDVATPVGSTFMLSVAPHALVRKPCEVVWRKHRAIGVRFV